MSDVNLIQSLNRQLVQLENSQLAKTRNMQFFNEKVQLYKDIKNIKEELKSMGVLV